MCGIYDSSCALSETGVLLILIPLLDPYWTLQVFAEYLQAAADQLEQIIKIIHKHLKFNNVADLKGSDLSKHSFTFSSPILAGDLTFYLPYCI